MSQYTSLAFFQSRYTAHPEHLHSFTSVYAEHKKAAKLAA